MTKKICRCIFRALNEAGTSLQLEGNNRVFINADYQNDGKAMENLYSSKHYNIVFYYIHLYGCFVIEKVIFLVSLANMNALHKPMTY